MSNQRHNSVGQPARLYRGFRPDPERKPRKESGGRPSMYHERLDAVAYELCSRWRASTRMLALVFGVTEGSIADWRRKHPRFDKAIVNGWNANDRHYNGKHKTIGKTERI